MGGEKLWNMLQVCYLKQERERRRIAQETLTEIPHWLNKNFFRCILQSMIAPNQVLNHRSGQAAVTLLYSFIG